MKKIVLTLVVLAVIAVAFGSTQSVFAQGNSPQNPAFGAGNRRGGQGVGVQANGGQTGILHDEMVAVYAEKLGLTVETLNARLAAGEKLSAIAVEKGLTVDELRALMTDARSQAVDAAVIAGELTQEQADWLKTRGSAAGGRGRGGQGAGMMLNPDCPFIQ